jgi:3-oxoacyl-[acyl-carrier protein] reductase
MSMDLGLAGRKAIVCASSRGLGRACAMSLAREGTAVVVNGRDEGRLRATAAEIRAATGSSVVEVVADVSTAAGRGALLAACPEPDVLVTNNGGPPPVAFTDSTERQWREALEANLLGPVFLIQAVLPGMRARRFGRIVNITSAMVKSPHPLMGLSTAARTGLTALVKAVSKEAAADNVTLNNLLPERFDTDRQRRMAELVMAVRGIGWDEARAEQVAEIAAGRLGRPEELGDACAFLCSAQAGFISGQNLGLDGGSYAGLL